MSDKTAASRATDPHFLAIPTRWMDSEDLLRAGGLDMLGGATVEGRLLGGGSGYRLGFQHMAHRTDRNWRGGRHGPEQDLRAFFLREKFPVLDSFG